MCDLETLARELGRKAAHRRFVLGLTGPPGSGKSTFAESLVGVVSRISRAVTIPMDGFHYPAAHLKSHGLQARKGSPDSFDVPAFISLLSKLREADQPLAAPRYCRRLHEPVQDALMIDADVKLVVVEGNYLLLQDGPWRQVRSLLDEVWYLDISHDVCMERVRRRHVAGGCTQELAAQKIVNNDSPNYMVVAQTGPLADRVLRPRNSASDSSENPPSTSH